MSQEVTRKGRFTIRSAGCFFILSGLFELFSLTSEVPFLGALVHGPGAVAYHLMYLVLFLIVGLGLWGGRSWGVRAVLAVTAVYTLDKAQYLLSRRALEEQIRELLGGYQAYLPGIDTQLILRMAILMTLVFVGCWWGFAAYIYVRRDYFRPSAKDRGEER